METSTESGNLTHPNYFYYENDTYHYVNGSFYTATQFKEYTSLVYFVIIPTISVLGILTNVLTFAALVKPPLNNFSPSVYLAAYCVSSALVCGFITGLGYLFEINDWQDIALRSNSSCKLWAFVRTILNSSPNWLLTGVAVDRIVAVWCPKRAQNMCTVFVSKILVCLIIVFLTTITVHEMWSNTIINDISLKRCTVDFRENPYDFFGLVMRAVILFFMPIFLLFLFGNTIMVRLCLKHHGRQIPNTSTLDLDLTYVVTVHSLIVFALNIPGAILQILVFVNYSHLNNFMFELFHYIGFLAYITLFFVMLVRCKDFREVVMSIICTHSLCCCSKRSSSIELRLMNEYNQVPSASTSV